MKIQESTISELREEVNSLWKRITEIRNFQDKNKSVDIGLTQMLLLDTQVKVIQAYIEVLANMIIFLESENNK